MVRPKSTDPKRNAGICLTEAEIWQLQDYARAAKISTSAVVQLLIEKGLPELWRKLKAKSENENNETK